MAPFDSNWCGAHSRVAIVPTAISAGTTNTEKLYSSRSMNEPARLYFDRENKATDAIPGVPLVALTHAARAMAAGPRSPSPQSVPRQRTTGLLFYCLLPAISNLRNLRSFRASYRFSLER